MTEGGALESSSSDRIGSVVTHHVDTFRSGVARFNEILAQHLGVPLYQVFGKHLPISSVPLLSLKVSEFNDAERSRLDEILDGGVLDYRVFLHDWRGSPLEQRLVREAELVYCGNHEVSKQVSSLAGRSEILWSPGLILDDREFYPTTISVFSFGMAHKIQTEKLGRLRTLLEGSGHSYSVYVSSANHETTSIRDAEAVFEGVNRVFPHGLYFLGNLSDVAVFNYVARTTFFAAFFERGVRANNGSVSAAMEHGAVVLTTLDEYSPPEYVHMKNIIDIDQIEQLPLNRMTLRSIGLEAMRTMSDRKFKDLVGRMAPAISDVPSPATPG